MPGKLNREDMYDFLKKFEKKIATGMTEDEKKKQKKDSKAIRTHEYRDFRSDLIPKHFSWYEKAANISEKILRIKADPKKEQDIQDSIDICHLNVTPTGVASFALLAPVALILVGAFLSLMIFHSIFYFS